jgi:hypothetical protein
MALYAFDGTWNRRDGKEVIDAVQAPRYGPDRSFRRDTGETNVHRFYEFYGSENGEYLEGVGTTFHWLGAFLGGAFGLGGKRRIRKMYRRFVTRYLKGDHHIDIVGFSRGAALALHFSHVIDRFEFPSKNDRRHLTFWYYRELGLTFRFPKLRRRAQSQDADTKDASEQEHQTPQTPRPIRFLGLWDAVATFGVPIWPFRNINLRRTWCLDCVPRGVDRCIHAMALDEVRGTFQLIRPTPARKKGQHYELWFRGVHSNIGGSYPDRGLSDIALAWMMEMYIYTLQRRQEALPKHFVEALDLLFPSPGPIPDWVGHRFETLEPNPDGELGRPLDLRRAAWRELPPGALIHHSVLRRTKNQVVDHRRSNLRLLRTLPGDARPVYDPPLFYSDTPRVAARKIAQAAFQAVPVRESEWLKVGTDYVFRSDDWIAIGQNRHKYTKATGMDAFVTIAAEWLLANKTLPLNISTPLLDNQRQPHPVSAVPALVQWVEQVLRVLEDYVPGLRTFP